MEPNTRFEPITRHGPISLWIPTFMKNPWKYYENAMKRFSLAMKSAFLRFHGVMWNNEFPMKQFLWAMKTIKSASRTVFMSHENSKFTMKNYIMGHEFQRSEEGVFFMGHQNSMKMKFMGHELFCFVIEMKFIGHELTWSIIKWNSWAMNCLFSFS